MRFLLDTFRDRFGIDLLSRIDIVFSDGSAACAAAILEVMPDVVHMLCLEHAKRNLGTHLTKIKKWANRGSYKMVFMNIF